MDVAKVRKTTHRMIGARASLLKVNPFFGHLAMGLQLACAPCGTACTDGSRLIFDPEFAETLSDSEMEFVFLHEILHCVLDHCTRGRGLLHEVYNIACDIVVNSLILSMWGMDTFQVAGQEVMHLTLDGQEGRLYHAEEIYQELMKKAKELNLVLEGDPFDRHDIWNGLDDVAQVRDVWKGRILEASKQCGEGEGLDPAIRELVKNLVKGSQVDWKQLLHDFIQHDNYDYTFQVPDRRFSDSDFFLPSFCIDEEDGTVGDIWVCVDTSGSISDEELSMVMFEILDAMRQVELNGSISFFDTCVTPPVPFRQEADVKNMKPLGGGGTSFYAIFRYLQEHIYPDLPKAILIFTDGGAYCPQEHVAMGVPVLWLISKDGEAEHITWGKIVKVQ